MCLKGLLLEKQSAFRLSQTGEVAVPPAPYALNSRGSPSPHFNRGRQEDVAWFMRAASLFRRRNRGVQKAQGIPTCTLCVFEMLTPTRIQIDYKEMLLNPQLTDMVMNPWTNVSA